MANYELGNDIMVSLGGEIIGGQKDCSLTENLKLQMLLQKKVVYGQRKK